ncbi:UNVERIFIED_CONTAM: Pollen receptor-like kinase [Sesamum radiatum]|uniref:Pollen receptor-like kinase n=1 Tax=Sesamum radiatum TaxID=300843 RepID=A0AAW2KPA1_SESRA
MWGATEIMYYPKQTVPWNNNPCRNTGGCSIGSIGSSSSHPPQTSASPLGTWGSCSSLGLSHRPCIRKGRAESLCGVRQNGTRPSCCYKPSCRSRTTSPEKPSHAKKSEPNVKITFLKEERDKFDMSDLLRASAEVLGSGVFGSTYKAALGDGQMMVVKRFKHMNNVNKEEFHEHMRRLGRLSHPTCFLLWASTTGKERSSWSLTLWRTAAWLFNFMVFLILNSTDLHVPNCPFIHK